MNKVILIYFILLFFLRANSQVLLNGVDLISNSNLQMIVKTDSLILQNNAQFLNNGFTQIDKDLYVNSGLLQNDGTIDINNSLFNFDNLEGVSSASNFNVAQNWTNNNIFLSGNSTVNLDGTTQEIAGSQTSTFYNLNCLGTLSSTKTLINTDAEVSNKLNLGDVEFLTNTNTLSVLNIDLNAIQRNTGFVSSLGVGRLVREVNNSGTYLFPVGSTISGVLYRPIEISTQSAATNYGVRLAATSATNEGFDIERLVDSLCEINPNFYHRIYGSEVADIKMYYKIFDDGDWSEMANWQTPIGWNDMGVEIASSNATFDVLEIENWNNFSENAYALGKTKSTLDIGNDITVLPNEEVEINSIYTGSTNSNFTWKPRSNVDCEDCLNIYASSDETIELILTVNERTLCEVSDTLNLIIRPQELFMPTGFTPNGDGINDILIPENLKFDLFEMLIFNRWGEKIFETNNPAIGWDGTFKGVMQNDGVFVYHAKYKLPGQVRAITDKGSITLIR